MRKDLLTGSGRRVAVVSGAVVAVIAAAVLITIWRYEAAISKWDAAQDEESDAASSTALIGIFWHEREAMNEYLLVPSPAVLAEIRAKQAAFTRIAATGTPEPPGELAFLHMAMRGTLALQSIFTTLRADAGTNSARQAMAIKTIVSPAPAGHGPV